MGWESFFRAAFLLNLRNGLYTRAASLCVGSRDRGNSRVLYSGIVLRGCFRRVLEFVYTRKKQKLREISFLRGIYDKAFKARCDQWYMTTGHSRTNPNNRINFTLPRGNGSGGGGTEFINRLQIHLDSGRNATAKLIFRE